MIRLHGIFEVQISDLRTPEDTLERNYLKKLCYSDLKTVS